MFGTHIREDDTAKGSESTAAHRAPTRATAGNHAGTGRLIVVSDEGKQ
jgi:hypothetical protein